MKARKKELLQLFKAGKTSLKEEEELKVLAKNSDDPALESLNAYFQLIETEIEKADSLMNSPFYKIKTRNLRLRKLSGIAAIMIIVLSAAYFIINNPFHQDKPIQYTNAEIETTYKQTLRALSIYSKSFKKGMIKMESLSRISQSMANKKESLKHIIIEDKN